MEPKYSYLQLQLLDKLGFVEYDPENEEHFTHALVPQEGQRLFVEEHVTRRRFYILITDETWMACEGVFDFSVFVLEDIGCDLVRMPHAWCYLHEGWLTLLKKSFEGHGFIKNGKEVSICA